MAISPGVNPVETKPRRPRYSDGCDDDGYMMSDGKPMAETEEHQDAMVYAIFALKTHFQNRPDVYVGGNNFVHYREGDRKSYLSPDTYVVFGVKSKRPRDNFKIWEEGASPSVVFEFTSKKTKNADLDSKLKTYEGTMQVREYFLFDPKGEYLSPHLRGMRLELGHYRELELDARNRLYSQELDLFLGYDGEKFRFYHPVTGVALLSPQETTEALEIEREQAERARAEQVRLAGIANAERARAERAEAEMAQLRAQLAALQPNRKAS